MEKYGFVYIWYDCKHKRFYIGCRWGHENDGYICSSSWMKSSYKRRPEDFKRRILSRVFTNKKDLLEEEYNWLSLIKEEELSKKYYNMYNHKFGHWTTKDSSLTTRERMSKNHRSKNGYAPPRLGKTGPTREDSKTKLKGEDRTEKQKEATVALAEKLKGRKKKPYPKTHGEKISAAKTGKKTGVVPKSAFKKGYVPWNKGLKLKPIDNGDHYVEQDNICSKV